jgi:hypothetical protein
MNKLAWFKPWKKYMPGPPQIWEREDMYDWQMDDVSTVKNLKDAYLIVRSLKTNIPGSAYRFFLSDSKLSACGKGARLALARKGIAANAIWPAPRTGTTCWSGINYCRDLPSNDLNFG